MDMAIRAIRDPGEIDHERVVLHVDTAMDIGSHMLIAARAGTNGKTLGGRVSFCFWFPDTDVAAGDLLVVYSKAGRNKQKDNSSGNASHFFYWGLEDAIWQNDSVRPVLIEVATWKAFPSQVTASEEQSGS